MKDCQIKTEMVNCIRTRLHSISKWDFAMGSDEYLRKHSIMNRVAYRLALASEF